MNYARSLSLFFGTSIFCFSNTLFIKYDESLYWAFVKDSIDRNAFRILVPRLKQLQRVQ